MKALDAPVRNRNVTRGRQFATNSRADRPTGRRCSRGATVANMPVYDDDLRLAHVLADAVERVTMARFRAADLHVDTKADLTWVSDADREAEELIRSQLARTRPRDAVHGEEFPDSGHGPRRWVNSPFFDPASGSWAALGSGAWSGRSLTSAHRIQVSGIADLGEASLSISDVTSWDESGRLDAMLDLMDGCWRTRAYGDFWSYMLVAEGAVDIAAEPELALHDMAALVPIVTEAGGRFTSLEGVPGPFGGNAVATNGLLHDAVLAALAPTTQD